MSIDSLYEGAIATLTNQKRIGPLSTELLTLKNNSQRVLYVYNILEELKRIPTLIKVEKSESVSTHYRNLGNQCYQKSQWYKSWQYYNLSLLYAPTQSDVFSLAISNRSAVFFSLKKYTECLEDVNKIYSINFPTSIEGKLKKRKKECETFISNAKFEDTENQAIQEILTMKGPKHPVYLSASNKIKVLFTKEMGRHVVAAEDIKVGELIAQEEPFFTLVLKSQLLFSCSHCMSRNLNLLPCDKCCFALYCSEKCKEIAWKDYHSIECSLMPILIRMEFTKLELLALRTVIKSRTSHNSWDDLFKTIEEVEANINTEHQGLVNVDGELVYDSKYYAAIHSLESNVDKRSISDIFQKSTTAAVFLHLLKTTSFLNSEDTDKEEILKCVAGNLLHHNMITPTNMHGIDANIENKQGNFVVDCGLGSAAYAFMSLLNHSCAPNTVRQNTLGTGCMRLYALRPIKAGMQLFDNYGPHHALADPYSRLSSLKYQYKFVCQCEACLNNWPTYLHLRSGSNIPFKIKQKTQMVLTDNVINKLQLGCKSTAVMLFKPLCKILQKLESYAPCKEVADCQESLKQCLAIFGGVLPYGYSQVVEWKAIPPQINTKK